jgi:putative flavoprotein involved in K+ transport
MAGRETLVGSSPGTLRRRHGVQLHGRAVDAGDATVRFAGGGAIEVGTVIWATGFRTDHAWIDVPVPDNRGRPVHQRGVTGWPGLCFLRLTRQHTRGSALLGWVKDDAEYIAHQIDVGG